MHGTARLMLALPLAGALVLAGCGGGGDAAPGDRQAGQSITIGEPNGGAPVTSSFIDLAQREVCADTTNRLLLIDQKYMFWNRSGRCGDNSYAYRLYGKTPEMLLCSQLDSIAGPRISCTDDKVRAMFDTIVKNLDQPDLGLGIGHKIEKVDFVTTKPGFNDVDRTSRSQIDTAQNKVIRDLDEWLAFWPRHGGAVAVPRIDFTTHMVIGVFMGTQPNGCYGTSISAVTRQAGKVVVTRTDQLPSDKSGVMCTMAITSPAHLVVMERSAEPVEFVLETKLVE